MVNVGRGSVKDRSRVDEVLDKCLQTIDAESDEVPVEWRLWAIELDVARKNWHAANGGAR